MVKLEEMDYPEFKAKWAPKGKLAFKDSLVYLETKASKDPKETLEKKAKSVPLAILA